MTEISALGREVREFLAGLVDSAESDTERRNIEALRSLYAAFNGNDLDALAALVAEDYESVDVAAGTTARGREAYRLAQQANRTAFPDATAEVVALHAQGDVLIAEVINRGTNTGPMRLPGGDELPPTGRSIEGRSCEIYEFRDGTPVRGRLYYDFLTVARQLGLSA